MLLRIDDIVSGLSKPNKNQGGRHAEDSEPEGELGDN